MWRKGGRRNNKDTKKKLDLKGKGRGNCGDDENEGQ